MTWEMTELRRLQKYLFYKFPVPDGDQSPVDGATKRIDDMAVEIERLNDEIRFHQCENCGWVNSGEEPNKVKEDETIDASTG
jgi:hypothetical protein